MLMAVYCVLFRESIQPFDMWLSYTDEARYSHYPWTYLVCYAMLFGFYDSCHNFAQLVTQPLIFLSLI